MLALISQGLTLGFTAGMSPGPLQTYLIQTTLTQGWRKSLWIVISPMISDIPVIVVTVLILAQIPPDFIRLIQIVGGLFLLWLARGTWLSIRAGTTIGAGGEVITLSPRQLLTRALMVNLLSPGPYVFWGTVNGPLLIQGLHFSIWHGAAFLIAFYGTFALILILFILVFNRVSTLDPRITRGLLLLLTLLLVVFGLSLIGHGVGVI